jgi:hypothetical protein
MGNPETPASLNTQTTIRTQTNQATFKKLAALTPSKQEVARPIAFGELYYLLPTMEYVRVLRRWFVLPYTNKP